MLNKEAATLVIVDLASGRIRGRVRTGEGPAANAVDWVIGTGQAGTHMVLVASDGATVFTSNIGSDSISIP